MALSTEEMGFDMGARVVVCDQAGFPIPGTEAEIVAMYPTEDAYDLKLDDGRYWLRISEVELMTDVR